MEDKIKELEKRIAKMEVIYDVICTSCGAGYPCYGDNYGCECGCTTLPRPKCSKK